MEKVFLQMKKAFLLLLAATSLACCTQRDDVEEAKVAAQTYYSALAAGHYREFLDGRADIAQLPDAYREQLLTAYKQFVHQQQQERGGIADVKALRVEADSALSSVQVFLMLQYGDATTEEVVVPMTEHHGVWKMK